MAGFDAARMRMDRSHLAGRGVSDARVLAAMAQVPRERFVDPGMEEFAYEDSPLPIGEGQTISQPYIVALMLEAAEISPNDRVLEVGPRFGLWQLDGLQARRADPPDRTSPRRDLYRGRSARWRVQRGAGRSSHR